MIRFLQHNRQNPNESVSAYKTRIRPVLDALPTRFDAPAVPETFFKNLRRDLRPTMSGYYTTDYDQFSQGTYLKPQVQFQRAYFAEAS